MVNVIFMWSNCNCNVTGKIFKAIDAPFKKKYLSPNYMKYSKI